MNHLSDHEWVIWIDSDAIVTDMDKPLTDIIDQAVGDIHTPTL